MSVVTFGQSASFFIYRDEESATGTPLSLPSLEARERPSDSGEDAASRRRRNGFTRANTNFAAPAKLTAAIMSRKVSGSVRPRFQIRSAMAVAQPKQAPCRGKESCDPVEERIGLAAHDNTLPKPAFQRERLIISIPGTFLGLRLHAPCLCSPRFYENSARKACQSDVRPCLMANLTRPVISDRFSFCIARYR